MQIRLAKTEDLEVLMPLFANARAFMAAHGNAVQWVDGYPRRELLESDIAAERLYVCVEDGHIYAAFVLAMGDDPTYQVIRGDRFTFRI